MKKLSFLPENFKHISQHLNAGLPVIFPTETCYGFSGNINSITSVLTVEKIKKRKNKAFLILDSSFEKISEYADITNIPQEWRKKSLTTPISFLLPKKENFIDSFFPSFPEVAVRVPVYLPLIGFLQFHKTPIFSTSCNIAGFPPLYNEREVIKQFSHHSQLLFVSAGNLPINPPSQLIKIKNDTIEKLR